MQVLQNISKTGISLLLYVYFETLSIADSFKKVYITH
jgi:hypothetical protein